jgi:hypothetical protein
MVLRQEAFVVAKHYIGLNPTNPMDCDVWYVDEKSTAHRIGGRELSRPCCAHADASSVEVTVAARSMARRHWSYENRVMCRFDVVVHFGLRAATISCLRVGIRAGVRPPSLTAGGTHVGGMGETEERV